MIIENAILGLSGTLGRYTLDIVDKAIGMAGGPKKISAEKTAADMPVLKAIVSRMPSASAAEISDFYDNLQKTAANRALVKRLSNEAAPIGVKEDPQARKTRISPAMQIQHESVMLKMEKASTAISRQLAMIRSVQEAPNVTPSDKRRLIELLTFGAMSMAKQSNQSYYQAEKALGR
jgi:hypothetical protein